ncbi:MAG: glycosyltransferase family 39 protein [Candidatus Binataceae bacterium]
MSETLESIAASHRDDLARGRRADALAIAAPTALAVVVCFFNLWRYGLWEPDEARYAEIAREMVSGASYLVPHLNYVIYVEKPPLLYWLTALSYHVFGTNEFAARFFPAIFAVLGVAVTAYFALRTFGRRHAILSGAILVTTPLYAVMAQVLLTDMILAVLVTIANFTLYLHWREARGGFGRWWWIAAIAMALGVLTKGPVAVALPVVAMLVFLAWQSDLRGALRRFHGVWGAILIAIIAAPWFIAIIVKVPGYFDFYFVGEHLRRIFQSSYSHGEPFWFYAPVLAVGMLPWSMLVPFLVWRAIAPNPARRFCVVCAIVIVGAFSCASAKLIPYILPAVPMLAILIADGLIACAWPEHSDSARRALRAPDSRILAESGPMLGILGAGVVAAAVLAPIFRTPYPIYVQPALYAIGAILVAGGAVTAAAFFSRRNAAGLGAIVITTALALGAGTWARIEAEPLRSYAVLGREVAARAPAAELICYHRYVQSLAFYTKRRVILVGTKTELGFGAALASDEKDYFFRTDADLMRLWEAPGAKVIVLDAPDLERLRARLGDYKLIGSEFHKRAILKSK